MPSVARAAPAPDDFAYGVTLAPPEAAEAYALPLPEAVYRTVTRRDLRDLRVFDARGAVVQHALCAPETPLERHATAWEAGIWGLPAGSAPAAAQGTRLDLHTADGTRLQVQEGAAADAPGGAFEYVLDARAVDEPLTELQLDWQWQSPEGRQQLALRVEASDDLDRWRSVVSRTTLLRAEGDAGRLERSRLALPKARYAFLRLVPLDERARDWLQGAQLLAVEDKPAPAPVTWFTAEALPFGEPHIRSFRSDRLAPVQRLRFALPAPNLLLQMRVASREADGDDWRQRVTGAAVTAGNDDAGLVVPGVQDRQWRVEITQGSEALGVAPLQLQLGYTPARLHFLAQGEGPWLLAYGSAQAPATASLPCTAFEKVSENVVAGERRTLGGDVRLLPPRDPLPWRLIVLWAVLGAGSLLIVAMALSLLRRTQ